MRIAFRSLLLLASLAGLASACIAQARPSGTWSEAFQSSPAAYEPLPPELARRLIEEFNLPAELLERMSPKPPVSGTLRFRFAVSASGTQLRIRISNEDGTAPLALAAASVGRAGDGFNALPGTLEPLTFNGSRSVSIPAGAPILSDPVDMTVAAQEELVVSAQFPGGLQLYPQGGSGMSSAPGDQTLREVLDGQSVMLGRPFVSGAMVLGRKPPRIIVTLGDSITDGNRDMHGVLRSWPEQLARRLAARKTGRPYAVLNAGIGGNRVLAGGRGDAALARLDRDVLRIEGVSHLVVLEGTNDIGMSGKSMFGDHPPVTAEDLIMGYRQIIARAHARGITVVMGTILPFGGAITHSSPAKEQLRQAANAWIRSSGEPDGVIDFDQITRDPADPLKLRKDVDSGDHLHPGEDGYRLMGDAIDLSRFR